MIHFLRLCAVLALALSLLACSGEAEQTQSDAPKGGSMAVASGNAMDFPPMDAAGLDAYLADNAGKPTMLFFWTTWCPSCKDQMPDMEALARSHADRINVVTVSLDDKKEALDKFFAKETLAVPVYHGHRELAQKFNVSAIPTLVIFDAAGEQVFSRSGVFPHSMLEAMADKVAQ